MTREEEIRISALKYLDNFVPDICGICDEDIYDAFIAGIDYADRHPKNVWHDASEHPTEVGAILYRTTLGSFKLVVHGTSSEDMWKVFVKDYGVVQWAYVLDLLPKNI